MPAKPPESITATNPVNYTSKKLKPNTITTYNPAINHLPAVFNDPSHILALDLEFFQAPNQVNQLKNHPREIAGRIFGTHDYFNYFIMDPKMPEKIQLDFLKQTDLPFSQTKQFTIKEVLNRVAKFMAYNQIHTIVSWDNSLDFKVLHRDSDNKILNNVYTIDLSQIIAQGLFDSTSPTPSLKNFCKVLNLTNPGHWHAALDDVNMICKIMETYAYKLVPKN